MLVEYRNDIWYPAVAAQLVEHFPLLELIRITQKPNPNNKYSMCHLGAPVLYSVSLLLSSPSRLHVLETTLESIKAESIFWRDRGSAWIWKSSGARLLRCLS